MGSTGRTYNYRCLRHSTIIHGVSKRLRQNHHVICQKGKVKERCRFGRTCSGHRAQAVPMWLKHISMNDACCHLAGILMEGEHLAKSVTSHKWRQILHVGCFWLFFFFIIIAQVYVYRIVTRYKSFLWMPIRKPTKIGRLLSAFR